jgi:hypothetical protein
VPPHPPDDGEENESHRPPVVVVAAAAANSTAAAAANTAAQLFGGSFQFIVQEQAKSMVAIQVKIASHTFLSLPTYLPSSPWFGLYLFHSRSVDD